ncbi:T9SS type A sorting domain-containing protein [Parabacteroides sp. FAFU027]|uniref:rhamnogalacturonan lyase family protein n=1 Tax=Parabacteroides sp. FAFU027 TaxID=2922715 RepID=UPI001FAEC6B1|nr:T9SS type A sorting domain-containing protein [Parabacteroides sp. FAFU027]
MKQKFNSFLMAISIAVLFPFSSSFAQRKMEKLDRGVVAVLNSSGNYFVSWRYFATDPENITYNVYAQRSGASVFTKLNSTPLTVTNFQPTAGTVANGTKIYVVPVINGVEGTPSSTFTVNAAGFNQYRSAYMDITYNPANDGLELYKYYTKFCWPTDLDGDGEYDFVVDRLSVDGGTHKIQAYLRNGTLLWTVDMGPNVSIDQGQDDMVIAYDMDGDNKAEVVIKSSDGTKFANGKGVFGSTTLDTDNDGIVDYNSQNVKNPPQYITAIDGMTGNEKNSIEMKYPSNYSRTNKAIFMGTEYSNLNGHMAIVYLDGKHPSVGFIYKTRTSSDQYHWYYASAYGYNKSGQWVNWYNWERGKLDAAEAHSIRSADVDLDGHDELLDIGYGIKYDGTVAFNAHISHGDRFRVGDIDPERPGLETFAIQQNASSMLGQLIYDSGTGEAIKKFYLSGVGDVGRGECMDVDSTRIGYEFWSTMPNIYDAKGNILYEGSTPWPYEGVWWDGDLARESLQASDGSGFNADIRKYSMSSHTFGTRLIEFAKMSGWQLKSEWGVRPAFFGDIAGDWREEVILEKKGTQVVGDTTLSTCPGIVAFSTDYPTDKRIYCLMQNPAYRMQATTKGYYQSAYPDFYLGYSMPVPPVSPVQKSKLTWLSGSSFDKSGANFVLDDEKTTSAFTDGDDVMFDISGDNSTDIKLNTDLSPSKIWAINPLGHDYTLSGNGKLTGNMELVKSQNGTFTLNGNHTYTGKTSISEGSLFVNGSLASPVSLLAKGTLGGNAVINGGITLNPGLNVEGGRLAPGNGLVAGKLGKMIINGNVTMPGKVNVHIDMLPFDSYKNDSLVINGSLTLTGVNYVVLNTESGVLPPGTYSLINWTGTLTGSVANFAVKGISGISMSLVIENNTLKLVVNATRSAGSVVWSGKENTNWDFASANFKINGNPTYFVNGDTVLFNDSALVKTVSLTDNMTTAGTTFNNNTAYILKGTGGIAGSGDFVKSGRGLLDIQTTNNTYTGKILLNNTLLQVASLADAGMAGSLGATTVTDPANFTMADSRLIINAVTTNSNRGITFTGNDTLNIPKSNGVASLTGLLTGTGRIVKSGPGQLNISGTVANTYTGGTEISGGVVGLGTLLMNTSGLGSGPITLANGGTIKMYYNTADYSQKPVWNITVPSGQTGSLIASGRCIISGTISGAGTLYYNVPYVRADLVSNCTNFTGKLIVTTDGDGGSFRITANANGLPAANVQLSNLVGMGAYSSTGTSSTSNSTVVKIGSLSGDAGSTVGGGTWQIGNNNQDAVFNGIFTDGATVTKIGTGAWTLSGASTCTATFTISGGKVIVTNTTGSATGTGTVVVSNGAMLAGTGTISGTTVLYSGATVMPGNSAIGTLKFGSNLSLANGSKTSILVSGTNNSKLAVTGTITLGGTLELSNSGTYQAGNSYTIFSAASVGGQFTAISPATPGEGLQWNTSRIAEGIISVDLAAGVNAVKESDISVYPNPVKETCFVTIGALSGEVKIELCNEVGTVVSSNLTDALSGHQVINMTDLQSGIYFVKISSGGKSFLRKVIKL